MKCTLSQRVYAAQNEAINWRTNDNQYKLALLFEIPHGDNGKVGNVEVSATFKNNYSPENSEEILKATISDIPTIPRGSFLEGVTLGNRKWWYMNDKYEPLEEGGEPIYSYAHHTVTINKQVTDTVYHKLFVKDINGIEQDCGKVEGDVVSLYECGNLMDYGLAMVRTKASRWDPSGEDEHYQ